MSTLAWLSLIPIAYVALFWWMNSARSEQPHPVAFVVVNAVFFGTMLLVVFGIPAAMVIAFFLALWGVI